jgi:putative ABC transport system permease protein
LERRLRLLYDLNSTLFHINFYGLVALGAVFTGLTFALQLGFIKSINRAANRWLSLALFSMVFGITSVLFSSSGGSSSSLFLISPSQTDQELPLLLPLLLFTLTAGPLIYLYVLKTTWANYKFGWDKLLHFCPLLVIFIVFISGLAKNLHRVNEVLQLLAFCSVSIYLYLSYRTIPRFQQDPKNFTTDRRRHELWRLRRLLKNLGILWLLWIHCTVADYFWHYHPVGLPVYYLVYFLLSLITLSISAFAFSWPEVRLVVDASVPKPSPSAEMAQKGAWLKSAMKTTLFHQDAELSLASLAEKLDIHTHELSRIINTAIKKNFYDFVNEYRVRDVILKMQDPAYDHITLLGIAFESGFNSKSTFNRIFKQTTGKSPVEYKAQLKKERPTYNLGRSLRVAPIILNHETSTTWSPVKLTRSYMFKNYLTIAWRNIVRNKAFSFINIFGLGLGIACSLLIFLWIHDERSVDAFHENEPNIYNVYERIISGGNVNASRGTQGLLATELKRKIPEIKYASGYYEDEMETLFAVGDKKFSRMGTYADSDFFKMFSYPLLQGTASSALAAPDDIAISRSMANSIFGSPQAAMGKPIEFNNFHFFKVSAVFEDAPTNTSQHFEFVINWQYLLKAVGWLADWGNRDPHTYIQLQPGANAARVEAKMKDFVNGYLNATDRRTVRIELGLQPLNEVYLKSIFKQGEPDGGRIEYVRLFTIVALFILIIACVNFMNLATARSVKRAKEVGIRKTTGAVRGKLIMQFIGEAMLLTFMAVIIALILVLCVLPYFNQLTSKNLVLPFTASGFWLGIAGLLLATGFIAGSYPAFFLSSLNPVTVLKGALKFSPNAILFRKGLVVFQFVLSIVLITGTLVISNQLRYIQTKDLGFDRENLAYIHFPYPEGLASGFKVFKQELSNMPGIKMVDYSGQPPSHINYYTDNLNWPGKNPNTRVVFNANGVGYDYFKLMGIQFAEGRPFSSNFTTDTTGLIINETAVKMMGFKTPLNQQITLDGHQRTILGVVKDFHFKSLHEPITPLIMMLNPVPQSGYVFVKTEAGKTKQGVASMEHVFTQMEPKFPFIFSFADEEYQKLYNAEMMVGKLSDSFSFLAIFISCLGLFGLTMFTVEQRRKEIGVRKIIGASEIDIVTMLSKDIVMLVIISAVIATPIAWLAMNNWLQNFAYRISLNWWIFLMAGLIAILVALATVCYQAIKAATANPVRSLRTE